MASVFVSYSRRDAVFARRLAEALERDGHTVWIDADDIPPASNWAAEIATAIEAADAVLFLASPDSARSQECARELRHAVQYRKRIVPVLHRTITIDEMPAKVRVLQWIDLVNEAAWES